MAWRLNSFFGCGKLETGGRVIGGIQLIWSLVAIVLAIFGILASIYVINDPKTLPQDVSASKTMITVLIILSISSVMNCIVAIFLIVGTNKQNPRYILVWLIVTFISTLISLLSNFAVFSVFSLITFGISIYLYLCIYSLYVKIKEEQKIYGSVSLSA